MAQHLPQRQQHRRQLHQWCNSKPMRAIDQNPLLAEKLTKLRQQYPGDFKDIIQYEKDIEQGLKDAEALNLPIIQKLLEDAQGKINDIGLMLAFDPELNASTPEAQQKRLALFHERDAHLFWLRRFKANSEDGIIKSAIDYLDSKLST